MALLQHVERVHLPQLRRCAALSDHARWKKAVFPSRDIGEIHHKSSRGNLFPLEGYRVPRRSSRHVEHATRHGAELLVSLVLPQMDKMIPEAWVRPRQRAAFCLSITSCCPQRKGHEFESKKPQDFERHETLRYPLACLTVQAEDWSRPRPREAGVTPVRIEPICWAPRRRGRGRGFPGRHQRRHPYGYPSQP